MKKKTKKATVKKAKPSKIEVGKTYLVGEDKSPGLVVYENVRTHRYLVIFDAGSKVVGEEWCAPSEFLSEFTPPFTTDVWLVFSEKDDDQPMHFYSEDEARAEIPVEGRMIQAKVTEIQAET